MPAENKPLISLPAFMRRPAFWLIAAMFAVITIIHYAQYIPGLSLINIDWLYGHSIERFLLLVPITYASYVFGLSGGITSLLISAAIMVPGAFILPGSSADAIFESIGIIAVGIAVNYMVLFHKRNIVQRENAEEMLARIIDSSTVPTFTIDKNHRVTYWNKALEALSGIRREQVMGTTDQWRAFYKTERNVLADLILDGASEEEIKQYYAEARKSILISGAYEAEYFFPDLGKNGKWLLFTVSPIKDAKGEITQVIETLFDVTKRKNAEDSLKFYLQEITKAQEEERKRIARELHDDTAQNLIALLHQLENLLNQQTGLPLKEAQTLWGFYERIRDILQGVRHFARDLRPSVLDDLGLIPALEWVTENMKKSYWIECTLKVLGEQRRLAPEVELLLFRIVQEALSNIAKHAHASNAQVKIEFNKHRVKLTVKDNGQGFEVPENFAVLPLAGKLGLTGLRERVQLLNGTMSIISEKGKGTTVYIDAPV